MPGRPFLVVASWGREAVVRPFGFATAGRAYFFFRVAFFATFFLATFFFATFFLAMAQPHKTGNGTISRHTGRFHAFIIEPDAHALAHARLLHRHSV